MKTFVQIGITILGGTAVYLLNSSDAKRRRLGSICGLCSQPLWFITTISHEQWGLVALCSWYTYAYIRGIKNNKRKQEDDNG